MRFILVHGAWHHGEMWQPVRSCLEAYGHEVHTPTAGGLRLGDGSDYDLETSSLPIAKYIEENRLTDYVLVGHSWGGYLISRIAIAFPERVKRTVFFAANVPAHGRSLVDEIPVHLKKMLADMAEEQGDGSITLPFSVWREHFFSDGTYEEATKAFALLRPYPYRTLTHAADMTGWDKVPQAFSYINPYEDNDIPQGEWARHPRLTNRLGLFRLIGMPGSHEVLLTNPELTAQKLIEASRN